MMNVESAEYFSEWLIIGDVRQASLLPKCKLLIQTQGIIRVLRCLLIVCCRNFDVYEAAKDHLHFHSLIAKGRTSVCSRNWYLAATRDPSCMVAKGRISVCSRNLYLPGCRPGFIGSRGRSRLSWRTCDVYTDLFRLTVLFTTKKW